MFKPGGLLDNVYAAIIWFPFLLIGYIFKAIKGSN